MVEPKRQAGARSTSRRRTGKGAASGSSSGKKTASRSKAASKRKAPAKSMAAEKSGAPAKTKAEPKRRIRKKPKPVPLPTLAEARKWLGLKVDASGGGSLGKVSGIHVDAESEDPKWIIAKMSVFAGEAAIPFEYAVEAGGKIWVAYDRDSVRNSPKLKSSQELNTRQELQLCEHYGIGPRSGRAKELAKREGDAVSAVPA